MSSKTKFRTDIEKKCLTKKLNIIEGQVRGVKQMIEEDRYCDDILIQISAIDKSLKSLGNCILKDHINSCVVKNIKEDKLEVVDELMSMFGRLN